MSETLVATKLRALVLGGIGLYLVAIVITALRFPGLLPWTQFVPELLLMSSAVLWYGNLAFRNTRIRTNDDDFVLSYGMKWGIATACALSVSLILRNIIGPNEFGDFIGGITRLISLLLPLVAGIISSMRTRKFRIAVRVGFWSGLVGGLIACVVLAALGYVLAFIPGMPGAEISSLRWGFTSEESRQFNIGNAMGGALFYLVSGSILGLAGGIIGGLIGIPLDRSDRPEAEPVVSIAGSELPRRKFGTISMSAVQLIVLSCMAIIPVVIVGARQPVRIDGRQPAGIDPQCLISRRPAGVYTDDAKSADEFLKRGDEAYDGGNCKEALAAYTQALALNPNYAEAYNNRAYTYMRMQNYGPALQDLDQALRIRPDYLHALMNRGDVYNYYFTQDRRKAIADYDHILRLGGQSKEPSVCGHRAVAIYSLPGHEGWNAVTWFKTLLSLRKICEMKAV